MKRIVITGASGFIGVHLIHAWLGEDAEVYAVVRPNSKNTGRIPVSERVHILACEMSDYERLPDRIPDADCFYHLAWEGARAPLRDDDALQKKNFACSVAAMEAAKKMGCTFFLGSGSQAEYGITNGIVDEAYPCNPVTAYGREKCHACAVLRELALRCGMRFIWTRIFSIYGPLDYPGTLIMSAMDKMRKNETIDLTAATQLWDYLHVEDAAQAMKQFALEPCEDGIYNLASGEYQPLKAYILTMKTVLGSESRLRFGRIPYGPGGPVNLTPDPRKARDALGWSAGISFGEGIRRMAESEEEKETP